MPNRELFEEACREYGLGQRLDIENYPGVPAFPVYERTRSISNELIESAHYHLPKLPRIHFDFVDEPTVNAWALKHRGQYIIGVTAGAVLFLHLVLDRMLANPLALPDIGEPSEERADVPPLKWSQVDVRHLFELGVRPIVPQGEAREHFSKHIAGQALMFLLGHEIAHVTRGHVDYLNTAVGRPFLAEVDWKGTGTQRLQRQALEIDADRRSIFARCNSMYMSATSEVNVGRIQPWSGKPPTIGGCQFEAAFAVNVLFRLFGDEKFSGRDLALESYPPLPLRRRMAMDFAWHVLTTHWGEQFEDEITRAIAEGVDAAEESFLAIGAQPSGGGLGEALTSEESSKHIAAIEECWNKIKPELSAIAYESLD